MSAHDEPPRKRQKIMQADDATIPATPAKTVPTAADDDDDDDPLPAFNTTHCQKLGYECRGELGHGRFGRVVRAIVDAKYSVAIKQTATLVDGRPSGLEEMDILKAMTGSSNVIPLRDSWQYGYHTYLVMDYFPFTLYQYLHLYQKDCRFFVGQLLHGVYELHERGFMHRDLKPANIMINPYTERLVIADLGSATKHRVKGRTYTNHICTEWYRAPELALGSCAYNESVDMWSVGCILFEMRTKRALFSSGDGRDNNESLMRRIIRQIGPPRECDFPFPFEIPKGIEIQNPKYMLNKMERRLLRYDSRRRQTPIQVLKYLQSTPV